ncbi:MAG: hypothetical protein PHY66_08225 [Aliarcobacter sp.]|nr:hypothetical protein [Aliarcobacter sp.]MDD2887776.1 hypothetical protein [Aliarcobacter sp.]
MKSKKDIVFLQSDASTCHKNKVANITVLDTYDNKFHCKNLEAVNSIEAEFIALIFSIKIAIRNKYKNVIFIYDCQSLNTTSLKEYCKKSHKFFSFQFLWLPRDFLSNVDEIARTNLRKLTKKIDFNLTDNQLFKYYRTFKTEKILLSVLTYLDDSFINEKRVIKLYLQNDYSLKDLGEMKIRNNDIFRFIYHSLNQLEKFKFYEFYLKINPRIKNDIAFKQIPKKTFITGILKEILDYLKNKKEILLVK